MEQLPDAEIRAALRDLDETDIVMPEDDAWFVEFLQFGLSADESAEAVDWTNPAEWELTGAQQARAVEILEKYSNA